MLLTTVPRKVHGRSSDYGTIRTLANLLWPRHHFAIHLATTSRRWLVCLMALLDGIGHFAVVFEVRA